MVPIDFQPAHHHAGSVIVVTEGGGETDPTLWPDVSARDFRVALLTAVRESRVFAAVRDFPPADYRLRVGIVKLQPSGAFTMRATMSARWQLTRLSDNQTLFDQFIESNAKATVGDAFAGLTRMRLVLERAGRENIRQGLTVLADLKLD